MKKAILFLSITLLSLSLFAAKSVRVKGFTGSDIAVGKNINLTDPWHAYIQNNQSTWQNTFKFQSTTIKAKLWFDDSDMARYTTDWGDIEVEYYLKLIKADGSISYTFPKTLTINYDAGDGDYTDIDIDVYEGTDYTFARAYITAVDDGTVLSGFPDDVHFDLEMEIERYWIFDEDGDGPVIYDKILTNNGKKNELQLSWNFIEGAESYDVEWIFMDIGQTNETVSLDMQAFTYDTTDAVRINTTMNKYNISLAYPRGVLVYRVRAVGTGAENDNFGQCIVGKWSGGPVPASHNADAALNFGYSYKNSSLRTAIFIDNTSGDADEMEPTMNWTYAANYAEDGKHKEILSFYDGSLRERQKATILNTDNNAVVGETKYDFQGRPAIEIAPVPVPTEGMQFYENGVNEFNDGDYDREDFDQTAHVTGGPTALDAHSQARNYYNNGSTVSSDYQDYVPDANGYAFTQTRYKNDGTDRIVEQSGIGEEFKVSENTTEYFYGRPTQKELERLFGSEVGYAQFYKKNLVVDPNGQGSVQYLDQQDRVIASAITGHQEGSPLTDLDYAPEPVTISDNLLYGNNEIKQNLEVVSSTVLLVPAPSTSYTFTYSLEEDTICEPCFDEQVEDECKNCKYDIHIKISKVGSGTVVFDTENATHLSTLCTGGCGTPADYINVDERTAITITVSLGPGAYNVEKTLVLNEATALAYKQALWDHNINLEDKSESECIPWELDENECDNACDQTSCEAAYQGTDENGDVVYYDEDGIEYTAASAEYATAVNKCLQACDDLDRMPSICDFNYRLMEQHMKPGGQYWDNLVDKYQYDSYGNYQVDGNGNPLINPDYYTNDMENDWIDNGSNMGLAAFKSAYDAWCSCSNTFTDWEDIRAAWDDDWLEFLMPFHPEYCAYQYFCEFQACQQEGEPPVYDMNMTDSREYDILMYDGHDDTYAEESNNNTGYNFMNPLNLIPCTTNLSVCKTTDNLCYTVGSLDSETTYICESSGASKDPLMIADGTGSCTVDFYTPMETFLTEFYKVGTCSVATKFSIWYVLDDPEGIGSGSPPGWAPTEMVDFFEQLHGGGGTGMLGTGAGQITRYQFFRAAYQFFKEYLIYEHFKDNIGVHGPVCYSYGYWEENDAPKDYDGIRDDYFALIYPKNQIFDDFDPDNCDYDFATLKDDNCANNCESFADDWIDQLQACNDDCSPSVGEIETLRDHLKQICEWGCDEDNGFIGSSEGDGTNYITINSVQCSTFTQVITNYYQTINSCSCATVVSHPPKNFNQAGCNCELLEAKILDEVTPTSGNAFILTTGEKTTVRTAINTDWGYSYSTNADLDEWISFCTNEGGSMSINPSVTPEYPQEMECVDCKCQTLYDYIVANDLATDPYSTSSGERDDIADALEADFGGTYTGDDVEDWLIECAKLETGGDPIETEFETDFPDDLRCPPALDLDLETIHDNECENDQTDLHYANAINKYIILLQKKVDEYYQRIYDRCYRDILTKETFDVEYDIDEYAYTLYYYDQAGNLVKTVPPEGTRNRTLDDATDGGFYAFGSIDFGSETYTNDMDEVIQDIRDNRDDPATGNYVHPKYYTLITNYKYNSFNQLIEQTTPDGGTTTFFYDAKNRLVASQNAKQAQTDYTYSYTLYDELGRIIEVGEVINTNDELTQDITGKGDPMTFTSWLSSATKTEITKTYYDESLSGVNAYFPNGQNNLRNRVASVTYQDASGADYDFASHYSYDIHGNVETLIQENTQLEDLGLDLKTIQYEYDLVSGNVNMVKYQAGFKDQFFHRYCYDADNRITQVETSRFSSSPFGGVRGGLWETDAKYFYYPHGPLARTEIGDKQVQGTDYAYTLQGWMKVMNSNTVHQDRDMGADGTTITAGNLNSHIARDAAGYSLYYHENDFEDIAPGTPAYLADLGTTGIGDNSNDLFNGNIAKMVTAMMDDDQTYETVHGNAYTYDQLNRIKTSNVYKGSVRTNNDFTSASDNEDYATDYAFDMSGNVTTLNRKGDNTGTLMDDFEYKYDFTSQQTTAGVSSADPFITSNKLNYVTDAATSGNFTIDVDAQTTGNSNYDEIGQLTEDDAEEIASIEWTVYNKPKKITRAIGSLRDDIEYFYGPNGHRIAKYVKPRTAGGVKDERYWDLYYYVRDAQGNTMATYKRYFTDDDAIGGSTWFDVTDLIEAPIYGSSRIGLNDEDRTEAIALDCGGCGNQLLTHANRSVTPTNYLADSVNFARVLGQRRYEQTNHLGNVLTTVSDRKIQEDGSGTDNGTVGVVDYYMPNVKSAVMYYPYGKPLPSYGTGYGTTYRYSFNGKEQDTEYADYYSGMQDYGFRFYSSDYIRFPSVDPLRANFAYFSTYQYAGNTPIQAIDLDGLEILNYKSMFHAVASGKNKIKLSTYESFFAPRWETYYTVNTAYRNYTDNSIETYYQNKLDITPHQPITNGDEIEAVNSHPRPPGDNGTLIDPRIRDIENKLGERTEFISDPTMPPSTGKSKFALAAYAIEGTTKYWFNKQSPRALYKSAMADIDNMIKAGSDASKWVSGYDLPANTKLDVINYVIDGTLPSGEGVTSEYTDKIRNIGDNVLKDNKVKSGEGVDRNLESLYDR